MVAVRTSRDQRSSVLLISGHSPDDLARRDLIQDGDAFLRKPSAPLDLAWKVREALDRR